MAEKSILWETSGTGDGTGSGYPDDDLFQLFRSFCPQSTNKGGVAPNVLNELAVSGTSSPVAVNTGQALVYGIPYFNSASVNVAISTPASLTRIDRIVLRADWTAQTVRITRIAGSEGGAAPAMTQSAGTTWDIPLATVSITTGGVITVTDAREWIGGAFRSGSFTPTLHFSISDTGVTYTTQTGTYYRLGNVVFFNLVIQLNSGGSHNGNASIRGLPYTANATFYIPFGAWTGMASAISGLIMEISSGGTEGTLYKIVSGSVSSFADVLSSSDISSGDFLSVSGWYTAA